MAAGKISIQANDGKVAGIMFEDGASSNVTVTVPKEGGVVATKAYADTKVSKTGNETISGVKTFSSSPVVPNATTATQAIAYGQAVKNTGNETKTGRMTFLDEVGVGVTPVAGAGWLQLLSNGALVFQGQYGYIWANVKYTDTYRYITSAPATSFEHLNGSFLWRTAPSGTAGNPISWTDAMTLDSSSNLLLTSGTGGLGYGTGAGGTVTQLTSKSTAVTLNKPSGRITMNNASLAAGATVYFILFNSLIGSSDTLTLSIPNLIAYDVTNYKVTNNLYNGGAIIFVTNVSGSTLSEAISINFNVHKGALA